MRYVVYFFKDDATVLVVRLAGNQLVKLEKPGTSSSSLPPMASSLPQLPGFPAGMPSFGSKDTENKFMQELMKSPLFKVPFNVLLFDSYSFSNPRT
jgi:hypothetical protein